MTRFKMAIVQPEAYKALGALDKYVSGSILPRNQQELIRIRASQINGCAYCVNHHSIDARRVGESEQRVSLVSVWREAPNVFNEEEQLLLAMTEEVTLIHKHGLSDLSYQKAIDVFGEEKVAQILMTIITINAWNRIGVSLNMHPDLVK